MNQPSKLEGGAPKAVEFLNKDQIRNMLSSKYKPELTKDYMNLCTQYIDDDVAYNATKGQVKKPRLLVCRKDKRLPEVISDTIIKENMFPIVDDKTGIVLFLDGGDHDDFIEELNKIFVQHGYRGFMQGGFGYYISSQKPLKMRMTSDYKLKKIDKELAMFFPAEVFRY